MPGEFTFCERPNSRKFINSRPNPRYETEWVAAGDPNTFNVSIYAQSATPIIVGTTAGNLYRSQIDIIDKAHNVQYVKVTYTRNSPDNPSARFAFDTTGGTLHVKASRETVASYKDPTVAGDPPNYNNLIGVHGDEVDGTDIVIPALKLSFEFTFPLGFVNLAFVRDMMQVTGTINNSGFLGFAPYEMLFLGAIGGDGTNTPATVRFEFAIQRLTIPQIGNILAIKDGWDYIWIKWVPDVDGDRKVQKPQFVYVERLYEPIDFFTAFPYLL